MLVRVVNIDANSHRLLVPVEAIGSNYTVFQKNEAPKTLDGSNFVKS